MVGFDLTKRAALVALDTRSNRAIEHTIEHTIDEPGAIEHTIEHTIAGPGAIERQTIDEFR